jgi:hypothetical protein
VNNLKGENPDAAMASLRRPFENPIAEIRRQERDASREEGLALIRPGRLDSPVNVAFVANSLGRSKGVTVASFHLPCRSAWPSTILPTDAGVWPATVIAHS